MYPPLTALVLLLVGVLPGSFAAWFMLVMLAVDLAVLALLLRACRH